MLARLLTFVVLILIKYLTARRKSNVEDSNNADTQSDWVN